MAKKTTPKKAVQKEKAARKTGKSPETGTRRSRHTSKDKWKAVAARRWPAVVRPIARDLETEGILDPRQTAIAGIAQARLSAMQQSAVVPGPAAGAAPPPIPPATGGSNWTPLGPLAIPNGQTYSTARVLVSGRVTAIAIDPSVPDTVYLGTAQGGVWKSTDNGVTWEPQTDNEVSLATGALAIDPNSPQIIYAGTGEGNFSGDSYYGLGILKSVNGGGIWTSLASGPFSGNRFSRIIVDPSSGTPATRLFAATNYGLYRSIDGGVNWTKLTTGLPANGAATDIAHDVATNTLYVAFWGAGIYRSTNANLASPTFAQLTSGLPAATATAPNGVTRIALGMSASNPSTVYALMSNNTTSPPATAYTVDKFYVTAEFRRDVVANSAARWQYWNSGILQPRRQHRSHNARHRLSQRHLALEGGEIWFRLDDHRHRRQIPSGQSRAHVPARQSPGALGGQRRRRIQVARRRDELGRFRQQGPLHHAAGIH